MWPVLRKMSAEQLNFARHRAPVDQDTDGWTDLRTSLEVHVLAMPDVAILFEPFFRWTEFFQTAGVTASFVCQAATELCDITGTFADDKNKSRVVRAIARAIHCATVARLGSYVNVAPGMPQPNGETANVHARIAQLADPRTWKALTVRLADGSRGGLR